MSDKMSGAELKVRLAGLGLQPLWLAGRLGVSGRTVVRWFDLDEIPAYAAAAVEQVSAETLAEMQRVIADYAATGTLPTYRTDKECQGMPALWHRALTFRVWEYLRSNGEHAAVAYRQ